MVHDHRLAARSVRSTASGRDAERELRPWGIGGLCRSRPPLPVLLRLARERGLLVWQGPDRFVLLEPPHGTPAPGRRAAAAAVIDRYWQQWVFGTVPVLALLGALLLAVAGAEPAVVLLVVLIALLWTAGWLLLVLPRLAWMLMHWFERGPRRSPDLADSALYPHWRITLLVAGSGPVAPLLSAVLDRAEALAEQDPDRRRQAR